MHTLGELADELNRQEWAVERMLKNRGYLKNNGDPRKSTIDDGLMNKNGLIKEVGWSVFIDELGYKDTEEDENEDEDIDDDDVEDDDEEDDELEKVEEEDGFIRYENSDNWWEGEYRGWRIRDNKRIAEKGQRFESAVAWSILKDQIDEFEDKVETLFLQIGEYRGWKIKEQSDDRIVATKKGYEDISVYLGGDIRSEIDEIEKFSDDITSFEEEYRGWKIEITIHKNGPSYSAEKDGAFYNPQGSSFESIKELIDEAEIDFAETQDVLADPESFSEEYKGWTIKANNNELIAEKDGEDNISARGTLDENGLDYCKQSMYETIDHYEIHKNDPPYDYNEKDDDEDLHYDFWKNEWV